MVFRYPVQIIPFLKTFLYDSRVKPLGRKVISLRATWTGSDIETITVKYRG
jgi:hypothetical protein